MVVVVAGTNSFIHHVNHFEIGVTFGDGIEPCGNSLPGFVGAKAVQPTRILAAPHESVELELASVLFCPVIASITTAPIETTAGTFNRPPLAFVFSGNLVPISAKVTPNLATSRNIAEELGSTIG